MGVIWGGIKLRRDKIVQLVAGTRADGTTSEDGGEPRHDHDEARRRGSEAERIGPGVVRSSAYQWGRNLGDPPVEHLSWDYLGPEQKNELLTTQQDCWAGSEAQGQMVEMFARWPMRALLGSDWPWILVLNHDAVIRNAELSQVWKMDPFINCRGLDPDHFAHSRHQAALDTHTYESKTFYLESRQYTDTGGRNFTDLLKVFWDEERNEPKNFDLVKWEEDVFSFVYRKDGELDISGCPHAFAFLVLVRMQLCMLTESAYFVERE